MISRQIFFRIIGIVCFGGGLFAYYDYGIDLLPLFERFMRGTHDSFDAFTVLTSFFLGGVSLTWVGIRTIVLRNFSPLWLYFAALPVTAWLQKLYEVSTVFSLDRILSLSIVYLCIYIVILSIVLFVHKRWFTPLSHEDGHHVALEKPDTSFFAEYKWAFILGVLLVFIIFNPSDALSVFNAVISLLVSAWVWVQG